MDRVGKGKVVRIKVEDDNMAGKIIKAIRNVWDAGDVTIDLETKDNRHQQIVMHISSILVFIGVLKLLYSLSYRILFGKKVTK